MPLNLGAWFLQEENILKLVQHAFYLTFYSDLATCLVVILCKTLLLIEKLALLATTVLRKGDITLSLETLFSLVCV
jgi:hypothetical protein